MYARLYVQLIDYKMKQVTNNIEKHTDNQSFDRKVKAAKPSTVSAIFAGLSI